MKQQFDLSLWLQDKSRKVVTRSGVEAEIIHDKYPLVAIINGVAYNFDNDGKFQSNKTNHKYDLFFADEEEELTEFGKMLKEVIEDVQNGYYIEEESFGFWKDRLLDLARKELQPEHRLSEDTPYSTETEEEREAKIKSTVDYEKGLYDGYEQGKQDALKDLKKK